MSSNVKQTLQTFPLSIPLTLTTIGTLVALPMGNKNLHTICGIILTGASILHTWQHHKKVKKDFEKGIEKMGILDIVNIPKSKIDIFIRSVEISSYIPGRIRLYSKKLIGNKEDSQKVLNYLREYKELSEVSVNEVTGSILIQYTPQLLHTNPELTKVENYIKTHVTRR